MIKNDNQSHNLLKRSILGGPLGTHLRIYESLDFHTCYFNYNLIKY
jgi:hypothetical protein